MSLEIGQNLASLIVSVAWLSLTVIIAVKSPEYLNLWASVTNIVLTYYLARKVETILAEKKVKGIFENAVELGYVVVFALVGFLAIVLFTYIFVHI
jgi:hypothetical protein